jgi:hypothetical protein
MFQEYLTCFSNVKSITFCTLVFVHQVGGFIVSKSSDGIGQVGIGAGEWLGANVDEVSFAVSMVAGGGSFQGGERTWTEVGVRENLVQVRWYDYCQSTSPSDESHTVGFWLLSILSPLLVDCRHESCRSHSFLPF